MKIISLIIILVSSSIIAQSLADYYPLQIGNLWFYKVTEYNLGSTPSVSYYNVEVVGDTLMDNGFKYFIIQNGSMYYERFDTVTNEIKYYAKNNEGSQCPGNDLARYSLNYSKDSTVTWESCAHMTYNISFGQSEHSDTSFINMFGSGLVTESISFKKYVGIVYHSFSEGGNSIYNLIGTRINGEEWGHLTSVKNKYGTESNYNLEQNYPNPFNPSTTIEFTLPKNSRVKLNVYNSLGQLITTILDKELSQGKHKVVFDGSNYTSGVYFYQLLTHNYIITKKFIFMK